MCLLGVNTPILQVCTHQEVAQQGFYRRPVCPPKTCALHSVTQKSYSECQAPRKGCPLPGHLRTTGHAVESSSGDPHQVKPVLTQKQPPRSHSQMWRGHGVIATVTHGRKQRTGLRHTVQPTNPLCSWDLGTWARGNPVHPRPPRLSWGTHPPPPPPGART